ncbi:hypothetical protein NKH47_12335 [Mesorhizobium sp. M1060]|uniref:hypothetical protein n=1 Tax=Mesorhizobium sp. M1060 TaxID=2957052 RepID=UPI00333E09C8
MQVASALQQSFKENNVVRIAIVDDGYDLPDTTAISEQSWLAFSTAVDESEGKFGQHAEILESLGELPTYGDLRNEHIHSLWASYTQVALSGAELPKGDEIGAALKNAFSSFAGRKLQKLAQLKHVEAAAREATGKDPICFQSSASAAELKNFDLIFLDFFLGDEVDANGAVSSDMQATAEETACRLVREVSSEAKPNSAPLFVVISSLASNDNVPLFRDNAQLLASKFRFLSKSDIEKEPIRRDFVLRGLVSQRAAGDAVEKLAQSWHDSIDLALSDMMKSIRRLDIADYAYIQTYRLSDEKISLLNYLTWLYNSYLGSFVEERLSQTDAAITKPISVVTSPTAVLRPMSEIPQIYSRITTTKVKDYADGETPKVWTGDLFVRKGVLSNYSELQPVVAVKSLADGTSGEKPIAPEIPQFPDVVAVVTPVCDLVPGRVKAKAVMLAGGAITELHKAKEASNHLLVYNRPNGQPSSVELQIKWDPKWPVTFPIANFDGEGIKGTDYVRVTRLRELYAAEIAQAMAGDLSRVGVPIAPPFTRPLDVQVRLLKRKQPIVSTIGQLQRPFAWDFLKKKSGTAREAVFSEDFLWALVKAVKESCEPGNPCVKLVEDLGNLEGLLSPFQQSSKNPTNSGKRLAVRYETVDPKEVQGPSGEELLVISLFETTLI